MRNDLHRVLTIVVLGALLAASGVGHAAEVDDPVAQAAASNRNAFLPKRLVTGTAFRIAGGDGLVMPEGTYYFTSFEIADTASIFVKGAVKIYLSGSGPFTIGGLGAGIMPGGRLSIVSNSSVPVTIASRAPFEGTITQPNAR